MKCPCGLTAVIDAPPRCETCFIKDFEDRFWETIEEFGLVKERERIAVAASGGKDSLTTVQLLSSKYPVDVIAVDEGIPGYRDRTLNDLRKYCDEHKMSLKIIKFEDIGAKPLSISKPERPCTVCGVNRRKAILELGKDYDVIATGHNLDDECQSILMNLLRNQPNLNARLGPRMHTINGLPARIKPLIRHSEKEVAAYVLLKKIPLTFNECPYMDRGFRSKVRDELNELERVQPGSKRNILDHFLKQRYVDEKPSMTCVRCGGPSSNELCKACIIN